MRTIIIFVLLLTPFMARGQPSPSVRFLMEEPVSMLDWGLAHIEKHLYDRRSILTGGAADLFATDLFVSTDYDWTANRIEIGVRLQLKHKPLNMAADLDKIRHHIAGLVTYLRGVLTLMPFDAFFRHKGFRSSGPPDDMEAELTGITELFISVRDRDGNLISRCRAPLIGTAIKWPGIGER